MNSVHYVFQPPQTMMLLDAKLSVSCKAASQHVATAAPEAGDGSFRQTPADLRFTAGNARRDLHFEGRIE